MMSRSGSCEKLWQLFDAQVKILWVRVQAGWWVPFICGAQEKWDGDVTIPVATRKQSSDRHGDVISPSLLCSSEGLMMSSCPSVFLLFEVNEIKNI
jgi:hypothetical protein